MSYLYYPGCSLKSTGRAYEESLLAIFAALGEPLAELKDWNCCGATAYMSISETKAVALSARNLALARRQNGDGPVNLVVPCAACYLGLNKAQHYLAENPGIKHMVGKALQTAGLDLAEDVRVRHPLDVLVNDIGVERIKARVKQPLEGWQVASYYGCQLVRPYAEFDDQHEPITMDTLVGALGAKTIDWPLKTRCCGGSLTGTVQEVGQRLSQILLREAKKRGGNAIATACPLCQFNLECYQPQMGRRFGENVDIPVAYFTQMMGVAFGLKPRELGLQRLFVPLVITPATPVTAGGAHVHG
jgi:heterodisulfide reductase subunit B